MRGYSRLSLKLFLLLGMVSLLSIGTMALLMSRELESGFIGYLNVVQNERLNTVAAALTRFYRENGSFDELHPETWRRLLSSTAPDTGVRSARPGPPERTGRPPPREDGPRAEGEGRPPPGPPEDGPPGRPPPPQRDPLSLGPRLSLFDVQGRRVIGPPPVAGASEVGLMVEGKPVGRLTMAPLVVAAEARDAQFLAVQKHSIATAAGIGLAISILFGLLVARLWVRRIGAVEHATARIAGGDFAARIDDSDRDEIGALGRNVNRMAESLSQLEQARRKWLADIAHELRTPLTVLQAEIEALQDGVRPLDKAALQSLADETRHLARLTDDLRLLALADMRALPMEWRMADAVDIATTAAARWQTSARKAGLTLNFVPGAPAHSLVDAGRLTQLFDNLLANSIRYTDAPGSLEVRAGAERGRIRLTFDDSPPGLAPSERAGLFEPLYRPDAARSRAKGGSGLGLALARAIVQAHGGTIHAADSPLGGVRIAIDLPITTTPPK